MRNLKRVLSTIMAVAMLFAVIVTNASAATVIFTDKAKIVNTEAVDMNVALLIIQGYEDGSFKPEGDITRGEMTKMIAVLMHGGMDPVLGTNPTGATFTDVRGHWAEKYIEYCVAEGIVAGMGDGTFVPDGNVTGTQAAKMLLVALGYRADAEDFNTSNWATRINVCAAAKKLYDGLSIDPNASLSRDSASQMIWNALQANEVEYSNEFYMTEAGTMATKLSARDRTQAGGATGTTAFITLLEDKYDCTILDEGFILLHTAWDKANKVFRYTIGEVGTVDTFVLQSATDYSDMFMLGVKVVVKNKDNKTILGMVLDNSSVLATGIIDDIESVDNESAIKMGGVKFRADANVMTAGDYTTVDAVAMNDDTAAGHVGDADVAWNAKLIDFDGNGRFDYVVYTPFNVGKVTYVGADSITVTNAGVLTTGLGYSDTVDTDTARIYEDIAKDDYVVIYPSENTPYDQEVIEKMPVVTGAVNRIVAGDTTVTPADGEGWYVDGTGYWVHSDAARYINNTALLGNEYNIYQMNGFIFGQDLAKSNYTLDDVLMVYAYEQSTGTVSADKAKVYFAKDGSSAVINVDELYIKGNDGNLNDDDDLADLDSLVNVNTMAGAGFPNAYPYAQKLPAYAEYKLFTFSEKNGSYILEEVCADNKIGFKVYAEGDNVGHTAGAVIDESSSKRAGTLDGNSIADEAVIFMVYSKTNDLDKVKVITGKTAASMTNITGDEFGGYYSSYLTNKVGNLDTVQLAVVADETQTLPTTGERGNYGFITSNIGGTKIDGTSYTNFTIYTKDGVKVVNTEDSGSFTKGDVISYADVGDSVIEDVVVISARDGYTEDSAINVSGAVGAIVGHSNGKVEFQITNTNVVENPTQATHDGRMNTGLFTYDNETVFMTVQSQGSSKSGVSVSDSSVLSMNAAELGYQGGMLAYKDNCVFVYDTDLVLQLVVVDKANYWFNGYNDQGAPIANASNVVTLAGLPTMADTTIGAITLGAASPNWTATVTDQETVVITIAPSVAGATISGVADGGATVIDNGNGTFDVAGLVSGETVTFTVTAEDTLTTAPYTFTFTI